MPNKRSRSPRQQRAERNGSKSALRRIAAAPAAPKWTAGDNGTSLVGARPLWLFVSEPGLAGLLLKELTYRGIVAPKTRPKKLNLRNYDMLVVPDVQVVGDVSCSRLALHTLRCPVFGRNKISDRQLEALEIACRSERANRLVSTVAGSVFQRNDLMRWVSKRLAERGLSMAGGADERPMWLFVVDETYYFCFPKQNHHDAPGRSREDDRSGSLPLTVAAAMVFSVVPQDTEVIWDPVVGRGTLLQEAALVLPQATLIGSDRDPAAVELASKVLASRSRVQLLIGEAASIDLHRHDVTLTLANPPWGRQFETQGEPTAIYEDILRSSLKHAHAGWHGCILTPRGDALRAAAQNVGGLSASKIATTRVRGLEAAIWHIRAARA